VRAFPQAYGMTPAGDGPASVHAGASDIPGASPPSVGYKVTPGARVTPLGSAMYWPPIKAMADRSLPPESQRANPGPG
jgi:hypothetical protein